MEKGNAHAQRRPWQGSVARRVLPIVLGLIALSCWLPGFLDARGRGDDDLFSVSFPNANLGWACGRWGTVLHTTDGGNSWVRQPTGTSFTLQSVHFVDTQRGWAVGDAGTILHTANGGKTWESQQSPVPYYLMGTYFVTPLQGWIVTERTHILHTDNGGKSWHMQFNDGDHILKAVAFADSLHGWTVGEYGHIYYTADGGKTWQKQGGAFKLSEETGEIIADPFLFDVIAVNPKTAWAVGIDGYVIRTTDAGKAWQPIDIGAPKTHLFGIATDRQGTIVIGGKGLGFFSVDHGQHWQQLVLQPPIIYGWLYGLAPRAASGFIGVGWRGAIYRGDAITSWQRIRY